jgi:Domain of unknown function (DUF2017)
MAWNDPVRPLRGGGYRLRLGAVEREALRLLCAELRGLIQADDAGVDRLFPAAYRDDPAASAEFASMVRGELVAGRLEAIVTVEATLDADRLDEAQLSAWCGALNDLRLVLGERLGVTEDLYEWGIDPSDPRAQELALYGWLTWLQGNVVEALASRL